MFPSKPIWLCHHRQNCLVYALPLSLPRSWNKSSASFKSRLSRISKRQPVALERTLRQSARSNFVANAAIVICSYLRARCSSSTCSITTFMYIPHQQHMHTNVAIHLRMHFPTSIVKFCLRCLGLAVSIFELSTLFFFIVILAVGSADFSRPEPMMDRRLRLANSSPDVKALFNNSPSYIYHLEEAQESLDSQPSYAPAPVNDYWAPQPPIGRHGRFLSMSHANDDPTLSSIPGRLRGDDGRASDPLSSEAKLKDQVGKPRSLTNRAQSLDLTLSLSRIAEGSSRYPPPDSPTNSVGDTGPSSSPTSATAPSFPNVYASGRPPIGPGTPQSMRRGGQLLDDEAVNEVSRVISTLGL
jgi:hypothetical protein